MRKLAIHLVCDGSLLEHYHDMFWIFRQWSHVEVDQPLPRIAGSCQIDLIFIDRRSALSHLFDQRNQGRPKPYQFTEHVPTKQWGRSVKELLGGHVRVSDLSVEGYHDHWMWQRIQYCVCGRIDVC